MKHMIDSTQESMCSFIGMCSWTGSLQTSAGSRVSRTGAGEGGQTIIFQISPNMACKKELGEMGCLLHP